MISKHILLLNEGNKREAAAARRPGDPIILIRASVATVAAIRLVAGCCLHEGVEAFGGIYHSMHFICKCSYSNAVFHLQTLVSQVLKI